MAEEEAERRRREERRRGTIEVRGEAVDEEEAEERGGGEGVRSECEKTVECGGSRRDAKMRESDRGKQGCRCEGWGETDERGECAGCSVVKRSAVTVRTRATANTLFSTARMQQE